MAWAKGKESTARAERGGDEDRVREEEKKQRARTRARAGQGVVVAAASIVASDRSGDSAGAGALGVKSGSWVDLQTVGSLLHLIPIPDLWDLPTPLSSRLSRGSPSWPPPPFRSTDSGLCLTGWSVSVRLSALLSDQPGTHPHCCPATLVLLLP